MKNNDNYSPEHQLVTRNPKMTAALKKAKRASTGRQNVLVSGELGTGKLATARRIHELRHGSKAPFVRVVCAAPASNQLWMFKRAGDSFLATTTDIPGSFRKASGGTVLFSQIEHFSSSLQRRLMNFMSRKGRGQTARTGLLATTGRNPNALVREGRLLKSLLLAFPVRLQLPPLRERPEDIPLYLDRFLAYFRVVLDRPRLCFTSDAIQYMAELPFPGNLLELRTVVSNAAVLARDDVLDILDTFYLVEQMTLPLPHGLKSYLLRPARQSKVDPAPPSLDPQKFSSARKAMKDKAAAAFDHAFLEYWYPRCGHSLLEASRRTGLSRPYLYKMAKKSGFQLSQDE